jgi:hypothetical protein
VDLIFQTSRFGFQSFDQVSCRVMYDEWGILLVDSAVLVPEYRIDGAAI